MKNQHKLVHNIKKYKLRSVYSQLIIMVVVLTAVLTAVSVTILCFLRSNMIEREKRVQEVNLEYTIEQLDEVIRNTYQVIYSIIGSSDVVKGLFEYDREIGSYAENKDIMDIISRLYLVYHSDENVRNVFIIQEEAGFVVDQSGITDESIYFKSNFGDAVDFWKQLAEQSHKFTLLISEDSSSLYVLHSMYSGNKRFATLCMELDMNKLQDRETFHEFVKDRIVSITDTEGNIVGYLSENCDDELVNKALCDGSVAGYLVLCSTTTSEELKVIALTPLHMVTGESTILFIISLIAFAVAIVFGIMAALYIAGRIYRPLHRAVELIEIAGKRGGSNEFEIIEHNMNAILEHNRTMTAVVARSTPIVLEAMFRRLIMEVDSDEDFEEMMDMMSIEVRDGYYMAVVIYADCDSNGMEESINQFFATEVVSLFKRHKDEFVLMLYLQQESMRDTVVEKCKKLLKHTGAMIAVGKIYKNIYSIGKSYKDALYMLDGRKAGQSETEVFDANCECEYVGYELPSNTESLLYNYIISGSSPLVMETINQSLHKNLERGISFREYQQLISVYELYLARVYENMNVSVQEKIELTAFCEPVFRMRAMEKRVKVMLENYCRVTEFYNSKMHAEVMEQIMRFIEDNMERDIGLEDVAAAVNLTPNYITRYFKNKSGMNFKACLTMKRIEKAKELLTETEMTVKNIAEKCGYNSSKQLIANFTKITGISPTEYRKCHRN